MHHQLYLYVAFFFPSCYVNVFQYQFLMDCALNQLIVASNSLHMTSIPSQIKLQLELHVISIGQCGQAEKHCV